MGAACVRQRLISKLQITVGRTNNAIYQPLVNVGCFYSVVKWVYDKKVQQFWHFETNAFVWMISLLLVNWESVCLWDFTPFSIHQINVWYRFCLEFWWYKTIPFSTLTMFMKTNRRFRINNLVDFRIEVMTIITHHIGSGNCSRDINNFPYVYNTLSMIIIYEIWTVYQSTCRQKHVCLMYRFQFYGRYQKFRWNKWNGKKINAHICVSVCE